VTGHAPAPCEWSEADTNLAAPLPYLCLQAVEKGSRGWEEKRRCIVEARAPRLVVSTLHWLPCNGRPISRAPSHDFHNPAVPHAFTFSSCVVFSSANSVQPA
jgi:hypothetical protein